MPRSYGVERTIDASATAVWSLLTEGGRYPEWNSSVLSIDGSIAEGETIELIAAINPKRSFKLAVSDVTPPTEDGAASMIWSDGMPLGLFKGVRTFELTKGSEGATRFSMVEVYTGPMAPIITRMIPDLADAFDQFADGLKQAAEAA